MAMPKIEHTCANNHKQKNVLQLQKAKFAGKESGQGRVAYAGVACRHAHTSCRYTLHSLMYAGFTEGAAM